MYKFYTFLKTILNSQICLLVPLMYFDHFMLQFLANDMDVLESLRWTYQTRTQAGIPQYLHMNP
jgi:type IV secretory pathway component VirB8